MEKDKEKATYESPVTKETPVNLESGICGSSVIKDTDSGNATTTEHEVNDLAGESVFGSSWE